VSVRRALRRPLPLLAAGVLLAGGAAAGYAAVPHSSGPTVHAGTILAVAVTRDARQSSTGNTSYVNLPGASLHLRGPGLLVIRFTAASFCDGSIPTSVCLVRIMVDGRQARPSGGTVLGSGDDTMSQAPALDRSLVVGRGLHTVRVQWRVSDLGGNFTLQQWSLTVERAAT
jgi:hypothetical protein